MAEGKSKEHADTEDACIIDKSEMVLSSGWKIHYRETGPADGTVVLFVHGFIESSEYWYKTISLPAMGKYRCVAIDLLGFGNSDRPFDFDYSMKNQAETIIEFLKLKKIQRVVYVGHSMGGSVGLALMTFNPEILRKLVLVDSPLSSRYLMSRGLNMPERLFGLIYPFARPLVVKIAMSRFFENPDKETLAMAKRAIERSSPHAMNRSVKDLLSFQDGHDFISEFKGMTIPRYYVYGTKDEGLAGMVRDYFPSESWVYSIAKAKHCPMVEAPVEFAAVLEKILSQ